MSDDLDLNKFAIRDDEFMSMQNKVES